MSKLFGLRALMGVLLAPAGDPVFSTNTNASVRRQKDFLEIAFKPDTDGGPTPLERIPLSFHLSI